MTSSWRLTFVVGLLVLTTACTVANYKKPVGDFAMATRNAEKALIALDQHVTRAYEVVLHNEIESGKRIVEANTGECQLTSKRCRLVVVITADNKEFFPPDPLLGNMVKLMGQINAYANGLNEIVNANTAEQVATQVNATLGSIQNLAKTVDELAKTSAAESGTVYKTSVGKAVNWLVGQYVARVQIDALRQATWSAHPVLERAAEIFAETTTFAGDFLNNALTKIFDAAFKKYEDSENESNLNALIKNASAYDNILLAKPSSVFEQLYLAHEALTKNLQNEELTLVEVMARIETFATEANALVGIIQEIAVLNDK